jgi:hypothetical protein
VSLPSIWMDLSVCHLPRVGRVIIWNVRSSGSLRPCYATDAHMV